MLMTADGRGLGLCTSSVGDNQTVSRGPKPRMDQLAMTDITHALTLPVGPTVRRHSLSLGRHLTASLAGVAPDGRQCLGAEVQFLGSKQCSCAHRIDALAPAQLVSAEEIGIARVSVIDCPVSTAAGRSLHPRMSSTRSVPRSLLDQRPGVHGTSALPSPEAPGCGHPPPGNLRRLCHPARHTATPPPPSPQAVRLTGFHACSEPWRIKHLRELQSLVAKYLEQDIETPIVRIIIGNTEEVIRMSDALWAKGFHVPAIRPPVVPNGTSRLRVSLSTEHTAEEVLELLKCLDDMGLRAYLKPQKAARTAATL